MNISYNNFTTATGSWTGTPTAPYQYKKISSNIGLNNVDTVITFDNLPAGMTVANPPTRTDPADRAIASFTLYTNAPQTTPVGGEDALPPSLYGYPFRSNMTFTINRINCISGLRSQYQNYLAPVDLTIYNNTSGINMPNMQNVSGCIMYQYINDNTMTGISGAIFLTGNGQSYILTSNYTGVGYTNVAHNTFFTTIGINQGPYIADYQQTVGADLRFFKSPVSALASSTSNPYILQGGPARAQILPDEILSSYTKLSDNSIKVSYDLEGVSSSLSRLHVLFNKP
jgi:hypothetical protein